MPPGFTREVAIPVLRAPRRLAVNVLTGAVVAIATLALLGFAEYHYLDHDAEGEPTLAHALVATHAELQRHAIEGYPRWVVSNPSKTCPTELDELAGYTDGSAIDAWGLRYRFGCMPHGMWLTSAGPDRTFHTSDDLVFVP